MAKYNQLTPLPCKGLSRIRYSPGAWKRKINWRGKRGAQPERPKALRKRGMGRGNPSLVRHTSTTFDCFVHQHQIGKSTSSTLKHSTKDGAHCLPSVTVAWHLTLLPQRFRRLWLFHINEKRSWNRTNLHSVEHHSRGAQTCRGCHNTYSCRAKIWSLVLRLQVILFKVKVKVISHQNLITSKIWWHVTSTFEFWFSEKTAYNLKTITRHILTQFYTVCILHLTWFCFCRLSWIYKWSYMTLTFDLESYFIQTWVPLPKIDGSE